MGREDCKIHGRYQGRQEITFIGCGNGVFWLARISAPSFPIAGEGGRNKKEVLKFPLGIIPPSIIPEKIKKGEREEY